MQKLCLNCNFEFKIRINYGKHSFYNIKIHRSLYKICVKGFKKSNQTKMKTKRKGERERCAN